jgi:Lrp/AsnC family leucine-responsive transcriptional regulator
MAADTSNALDKTDIAILMILQTEGRLGVTEIGRRVNLTQPAVSARIKRLEQSGIITGYRAVVEPSCLGLNIHAVIRLRTTHAKVNAALDHFTQLPEITNLYRLAGEDCFLIDVHADDTARLETIVDNIAQFGPVVTSLVLRSYPPAPVTPRISQPKLAPKGNDPPAKLPHAPLTQVVKHRHELLPLGWSERGK